MQWEMWDALFSNLTLIGIGLAIFLMMSFLIFFYSNKQKTGPLGLRGKHARPFVMGMLIMSVGIMMGFLYYMTMGTSMDLVSNTGLSVFAFGLGILFGFMVFIRLYREAN